MATFSGLLSHTSVLGHKNGNPMLSFRRRKHSAVNNRELGTCNFVPKWIPRLKMQSLHTRCVSPMFSMSRGGNYGLKFDDEHHEDPFWVQWFKETVGALKVLFAFLIQQPGQLKYIEWPSFQDTLRTATLTLVLVAMLVVALSSIDSALSFVLALFLRRPA